MVSIVNGKACLLSIETIVHYRCKDNELRKSARAEFNP